MRLSQHLHICSNFIVEEKLDRILRFYQTANCDGIQISSVIDDNDDSSSYLDSKDEYIDNNNINE